ncbi:hypothetical protein HMPREF0201_00729 [Cedecea davisae DSM 4568]|uniref:Uncharacterized protein n=1 Tax=Cedecea davisae DSM 4568 TaxID=566551 RepID=S3K4Z0_9ENTR|nr:hypothetical protein HMPREF0201_00729 [Cedecea davisae DSM 4568]
MCSYRQCHVSSIVITNTYSPGRFPVMSPMIFPFASPIHTPVATSLSPVTLSRSGRTICLSLGRVGSITTRLLSPETMSGPSTTHGYIPSVLDGVYVPEIFVIVIPTQNAQVYVAGAGMPMSGLRYSPDPPDSRTNLILPTVRPSEGIPGRWSLASRSHSISLASARGTVALWARLNVFHHIVVPCALHTGEVIIKTKTAAMILFIFYPIDFEWKPLSAADSPMPSIAIRKPPRGERAGPIPSQSKPCYRRPSPEDVFFVYHTATHMPASIACVMCPLRRALRLFF